MSDVCACVGLCVAVSQRRSTAGLGITVGGSSDAVPRDLQRPLTDTPVAASAIQLVG